MMEAVKALLCVAAIPGVMFGFGYVATKIMEGEHEDY